MNIGIIGSGSIGATAAQLFITAGNRVLISNSRGPESLHELIASLGENAQAGTPEEAAHFGEIVLVAVPFGRYKELPASALTGKIVIDANNYYPDRDNHFPELDREETTSSEMLAAHLAGATIIKAFNTIYYKHLETQGDMSLPIDDRRVIFVAGDNPEAKEEVTALIESIGFGTVDTGTLRDGGRKQQPNTPVYNRELTVREARVAIGNG